MIRTQGFSRDQRKGGFRHVMHRFTEEERQQVLSTVNDPRLADLTPGQTERTSFMTLGVLPCKAAQLPERQNTQ